MKNFFKFLFISYVYECTVCMQICAPMSCSAAEVRRGHQIPLELELQTVVSCHVSAGNGTQVLCKSNQYSLLLSHLSSPIPLCPSPSTLENIPWAAEKNVCSEVSRRNVL